MGGATLGGFRSTPLGVLAAESGFTPARALLNHRQASFARRLYARHQGGNGPEIPERRNAALTTRIRASAALHRHETVEAQEWGSGRRFAGRVILEQREAAILTANQYGLADQHGLADTVWTDGSRLDNEKVGAAFVWRRPEGWQGSRFHLGSNKEVFDAEVFFVLNLVFLYRYMEPGGLWQRPCRCCMRGNDDIFVVYPPVPDQLAWSTVGCLLLKPNMSSCPFS